LFKCGDIEAWGFALDSASKVSHSKGEAFRGSASCFEVEQADKLGGDRLSTQVFDEFILFLEGHIFHWWCGAVADKLFFHFHVITVQYICQHV